MFIDAREVQKNTTIDTEVCIIGTGAAGITLAKAFKDYPAQITVLESGDFEFDRDTQDLYIGKNIGEKYGELDQVRFRYFGGTTNAWAGYVRPLDKMDFETRSWIPHSGWPINRKQLDPYYKKAYSIIGIDPEFNALVFADSKRLKRLPLDSNKITNSVFPIKPTNFGKAYKQQLKLAKNVRIYLHANLTSLETDESGANVNVAKVACLNGNTFRVRAKTFVLACGGIENSRILLSSNKLVKQGLGNQYDQVGRYFMEHPHIRAGVAILPKYKLAFKDSLYDWYKIKENFRLKGIINITETVQREQGIANFMTYLAPYKRLVSDGESSVNRLIDDVMSGDYPDDMGMHVGRIARDIEDIAAAAYEKVMGPEEAQSRLLFYVSTEQVPNPKSRITLGTEQDALGIRRVNLDWQFTDLDKRTIIKGLEVIGAELGRLGLGRVKVELEEDEAWPDRLYYGPHFMGTTRMHNDPRQGVVDENCRVHSMRNLYIAGASVFPTAGIGTPTLTITALALRLVDHLKGKLKNA